MENEPDGQNLLRTEAESQLALARPPEEPVRSAEELLHELQVHQIELEMQNDELRRAQIAMEESRDRYVDLYEFAPVGYLTLNNAGLIAEANLTGAKLLGMERRKLLYRRFEHFVVPQDRERWNRLFMGLIKHDRQQNCEMELRRDDGTFIHVRLDFLRGASDADTPLVRIAITDISERIGLLLESTAEGIYAIDDNGCCIIANPACARILGYASPRELIGRDMHRLMHYRHQDGRDYPADACPVDQVVRSGKPLHRCEDLFWRADGSSFPVELSASPMRHENAIIGAVVSFVDITERKRSKQALRNALEDLREKEALLRIITDNTPDPIYVMGIDSRALMVNPATLRVIGKTEQEVLGKTDAEIFDDPAVGQALMENDRRVMESGVSQAIEETVISSQGTRTFLSIKTPYRDAGGKVIGIVGISHDITERKEAEQAMYDANQRKDEFLSMLAHELRNPLVPIRNAAHVLGLLELEEPKIKWARELIERQVTHLTRMVDDLLDVSRIARGKIVLQKEAVGLAALVEQVMESARPLAESKGHQLTVRVPGQAVWLEGDPVRLTQVLFNLLDNAIKYTPEGGRIELDARMAGQEIEIGVRDNGAGIPPGLLPRVFDLFQQDQRTLDRAQGGLGIGLTLVQRLVGMHGGRVEAHSKGPGQGSTFTVWLPVGPAPSEPPAHEARDTGSPAAGLRVLVVDDDHAVADSTAVLLDLEGYGVRIAHDGHEALALIPEFRPQVVLLDIGLKGMNGFETAKRLRALPEGRDLYLVALTGYGDAESKARALSSGCDHFLVKPVGGSALSKLLAESMQNRSK